MTTTKKYPAERTNPSDVDVLGIAKADAAVTVNGDAAYRKGEYYRASVSVTNSGTNVFQAVSNLATLGASTDLTTGGLLVPKVNQTFAYDADGNLTNDSVFTYFWDAENRLISLTNNGAANQGFLRQTMTYDSTSRRVRLQVETNSGASFVTTRHLHFVNDGWNLVAELNATNHNAVNTFLWGAGNWGILENFGGSGGLLSMISSGSGIHSFVYDGNGNVAGLVNSADGSVSAYFEYGSFGELLRAEGPMAAACPFRFCTKYQEEAGLLYYGLRYYSLSAGIWVTRDPIREFGGLNLYSNCRNDSINYTDALGLAPGMKACIPAIGPPTDTGWTMFHAVPDSSFTGGGGAGAGESDGVTLIYKRVITTLYVCPCACPSSPAWKMRIQEFYHEVAAASPSESITWGGVPGGPWPPINLVDVIIDRVNSAIWAITPRGPASSAIVSRLWIENVPPVTVAGMLKKDSGVPRRFCVW